jgi:hypothetical protein
MYVRTTKRHTLANNTIINFIYQKIMYAELT